MLSLMRSECYQIRKMLSVKITFMIILVASVIFSFQTFQPDYVDYMQSNDRMYELYGGGGLCSVMEDSAACLLLASLFAGFLISAGFENRTIQTAVSCGKSRTKVYLAKMFSYIMVVTLLSMVYWFGSNTSVFLKNGLGSSTVVGNLNRLPCIAGMVIAASIAYASLYAICGVVSFFSRKVGMTMGICFLGILFGGRMVTLLLPEAAINWINLTPLGLYQRVLTLDVSAEAILQTCLLGILWTTAICCIGWWKFKRTGLK